MTERDIRQAFEDHKDAVYDFALRMTGWEALAEDVAQDCFLELLRQPGKFDAKRGSLRTYLFGITRNLVHRRWRTENRWVDADTELQAYLPDFMAGNIAESIRCAVQSLPPLQREAVVLFEYEGFTLDEIAAIASVDVGAVKSRLHRAREKLREILAPLRTDSGVSR